jgi:hypothetical protein
MISIESIRVTFEIAGYIGGLTSVTFIARSLIRENELSQYRLLQGLEQRYTDLLWASDNKAYLDNVWHPIDEDRKAVFDAAIQNSNCDSWDFWRLLTAEEKACYRLTRAGLEILEQAHLAQQKRWVKDKSISGKWDAWIASWKQSNSYLPYVLHELNHWFAPSFIERMSK